MSRHTEVTILRGNDLFWGGKNKLGGAAAPYPSVATCGASHERESIDGVFGTTMDCNQQPLRGEGAILSHCMDARKQPNLPPTWCLLDLIVFGRRCQMADRTDNYL